MNKLQIVEQNGMRVLTSIQLAKAYETSAKVISHNYARNRERYLEGKHFIRLQGEELRIFKTSPQFEELSRTNRQIGDSLKRVNMLYLWTEKGALLHAKSLNTDKAWEVYDYLVDFYFRAKENELRQEIETEGIEEEHNLLSAEDLKRISMNRGIVLGVYRAENEHPGMSIMDVYNRLSSHGKKLVQSMIFGEVHHG